MALRDKLETRLSTMSEWQKRVVTGLILAIVSLTAILLGGYVFTGFVILCALLMLLEWNELNVTQPWGWRWGGLLYIFIPTICLIMTRNLVIPRPGDTLETMLLRQSPLPILHLICMVAATDIGAYLVGRKFGQNKIAPLISPGKTWEGLVGGIIGSLIVGAFFAPWVGFPKTHTGAILLGIVIACIAQAGDFFESSIKRRAGVKDSGQLLPGHGGLLDRFDGLLFAAPVYYLLTRIDGSWLF